MKIFFSGDCTADSVPEVLVPQNEPDIMFTFFEIRKRNKKGERNTNPAKRFRKHLKNNEDQSK